MLEAKDIENPKVECFVGYLMLFEPSNSCMEHGHGHGKWKDSSLSMLSVAFALASGLFTRLMAALPGRRCGLWRWRSRGLQCNQKCLPEILARSSSCGCFDRHSWVSKHNKATPTTKACIRIKRENPKDFGEHEKQAKPIGSP